MIELKQTEVEPGLGPFRIQLRRLKTMRERTFMITRLGKHRTEVHMCTGVIRTQHQRLPQLLGGTGQISRLVQGITEVVAQNRLIRHPINGLPDVENCRRMITLLVRSQTQKMQGIGISGLPLKNSQIKRLGRFELTGPMELRGLANHFL